MSPIRAKFVVSRIERSMITTYSDNQGKQQELNTIVMHPVSAHNDPEHENNKFWQYTPSGEFKLGTVNAEAVKDVRLGGVYYIDIIPAEETTPVS